MYPDWLTWMKKPLTEMLLECERQVAQFPRQDQQQLSRCVLTIKQGIKHALHPATYYQIWEDLINLQRYFREHSGRQPTSQPQISTVAYTESIGIEKAEGPNDCYAPYQPVPIGQHQLPPLPYNYDALEPYIDQETMRIHHAELHKKYVDDLNRAERELKRARTTKNYDLIKHWERELSFNGAGHYLHTIFFSIMGPKAGGEPRGALLNQITKSFGSYQAFKEQFMKAAEKVEGSGWAMLVWSPRAHRLEILQAEKHQNLSQQDQIPILVLDVWEHAYYLKYPIKRRQYIENWFRVVDWMRVAKRYDTARKVLWQPY